ncbi:transketolase C-terminal domain-containing protein, partial [Acidithiobacillus sp.]
AFLTVEEGAIMGGAGSAVAECLLNGGRSVAMRILGLPDQFIEQGEAKEWLAELGLDAAGIESAARALLDGLAPGAGAGVVSD